MQQCFVQSAFIGPGGPEFLLVLFVLLLLFGAKDAPRILRKLNEIISQIRNTADGFKREVMYSDLDDETPSYQDDKAGEEDSIEERLREEPEPEEPEPEEPADEEGDAEKA